MQGLLLAALHSDNLAMPAEGTDPLAENFARILCERASFELREEDVHAYRRRLSSLQHAVQVSAAAKAQEDEEYRQWQVGGGPGTLPLRHMQSLCITNASLQAVQGPANSEKGVSYLGHLQAAPWRSPPCSYISRALSGDAPLSVCMCAPLPRAGAVPGAAGELRGVHGARGGQARGGVPGLRRYADADREEPRPRVHVRPGAAQRSLAHQLSP